MIVRVSHMLKAIFVKVSNRHNFSTLYCKILSCSSHTCPLFVPACSEPIALGLESGYILDAQLTSSSEHAFGYKNTKFARLNQAIIAGVTIGGWGPRANDLSNPWLQIDFRVMIKLTFLL